MLELLQETALRCVLFVLISALPGDDAPGDRNAGRGRASLRSCASSGVPMAAAPPSAGLPMAVAPGRAPARPLAEKQNWASVRDVKSLTYSLFNLQLFGYFTTISNQKKQNLVKTLYRPTAHLRTWEVPMATLDDLV